LDWRLDESKIALMEFTQKLIQMRRDHPNLHRRKFYQGRAIRGTEEKDIVWLRPDGQEMSDEEWGLGWVRCLGLMLNGETIGEVDDSGEPIKDYTFLIMLNCHHEPIQFYLPQPPGTEKWEIVIDTNDPGLEAESRFSEPGSAVELVPLSLVVCRESKPPSVSRLLTPERQ
jgi:glycogen operon protein